MNHHTIEIASDTHESEQFVHWLNAHGHTATIGRSTGNYVDGVWTSNNTEANETFRKLWESYCSQ